MKSPYQIIRKPVITEKGLAVKGDAKARSFSRWRRMRPRPRSSRPCSPSSK